MVLVKARKRDVIFVLFMFLPKCRSEEAIICEETFGDITCPNDGLIHIDEARYGRTQSGEPKCNHLNHHLTTDGPCVNDVQLVVCHLKNTCQLRPNNDGKLYGTDPCPNIKKYLNVTYTCKMNTGAETNGTRKSTIIPTEEKTKTFTTEEAMTEQQTTSVSPNIVSKDCRCRCSDVGTNRWEYLYKIGLTRSEMRSIMAHYLETLVQNITIDRTSTDRMYRKKRSASDDRVSAKSLGCVGVAVVVTVPILSFAIDILNICKMRRLLPKKNIGNYRK